VISDLRR